MKALLLAILILISTTLSFGQTNTWRGITPLHSTRAEVEKLLGKPKKCKYADCTYENDKEKISFTYVEYRCKDGWNIPKDTVSYIFIEQKDIIGKHFSELKLDESKFKTIGNAHDLSEEWLNVEEGVSYHFRSPMIFVGKSYQPKKEDNNNLRCDGFPPYTPEDGYYLGGETPIYDPKRSSRDLFFQVIADFDSLISAVRSEKQAKGYAYVYFDNKLSLNEYRKRVKRIKAYLIKTRKILPDEINIIEGGLRESSTVEFYLVREGQRVPTPTPTLPSPQFMRKQTTVS